ncbi:DegT/DnrJ/EryC1/StrS family aminotransferase [Lentisphaera profundi]|uniref:DegT/DnrJ/EryC1/StrS family aminotransferase n=1 Tax=Lentisphaera profundi TaxID=1658616 RepID=A0ABY7VY37_9BACT|nr:DegT/DnrJ/EryC1/StrS family aminotransferase [Lentisphaera profundi]WDE99155.1 DegT/DnrJ/EryC1/StrS family aminotransferase [Lentisphaera profundi]
MQFIDLKSQYKHLKSRIDERIHTVLDHGKYIMGPEVLELEQKLAEYVGVKHVITCANGTDALQLALMALNIGPGDAVFCPTFTFFATAEAISFVGATPVFVDSDEETFNICPKDLRKRIIKIKDEGKLKLKAIMPVDLFGLPADYPKLNKIAKEYNMLVIEDAAQGFGGEIDGQKAGSFGDIATTSFFPAKPLGCYGDGGALFTNDDDIAELLRSYRVHGKGSDKYDNVRIGMNSRLDTIQAAILLEKLTDFPQELSNRNDVARHYNSSLLNNFLLTPKTPTGFISSWAQYSLRAENSTTRQEIMQNLKNEEIPSVIYYAKCLHLQTAFKYLTYIEGDFPIAEKISTRVFSIPMSGYISKDTASLVIKKVNKSNNSQS